MRRVMSLLRAGLLLFAALPDAVQACSLDHYDNFQIDDTIDDAVPPSKPTLGEVTINRGRGPRRRWFDLRKSFGSCDDLGWIVLELSAQDNLSGQRDLGFVFTLESGAVPFDLPTAPAGPSHEVIVFSWIDGLTDDQEPIDATLLVNTVDRAGNVSAESLRVTLHDEGSTACLLGCTTTSGAPGLGLLGLGLVGLTRRRARRRA